jgi:hypothetical protein
MSATAMRTRAAAVSAALAACVLGVFSLGRASDHLDGPRATADPAADIADVFAFTSPEDPSRVVLAMTLTPYATDASAFAADVSYAFRVQRVAALEPLTLDATPLDVMCTYDAGDGSPPAMACTGPGGASARAILGEKPAAGAPMRVFAGLRSDPAFFDRQGALATVGSGKASFTGANAFAGANVLAIVVEIDAALFAPAAEAGAEAGAPVLAVAAETVRRGP